MNQDISNTLKVITELAREIIAGSYKNVDRIFQLTNPETNSPECSASLNTFSTNTLRGYSGKKRSWISGISGYLTSHISL